MTTSLGDEYPKQQARLRELRAEVVKMPVNSMFLYLSELDSVLNRADVAAISGDVVQMLGVYKEMTEFNA